MHLLAPKHATQGSGLRPEWLQMQYNIKMCFNNLKSSRENCINQYAVSSQRNENSVKCDGRFNNK